MRGYLRLSGVRSRLRGGGGGAHAAVFAVKVRAASVASIVRPAAEVAPYMQGIVNFLCTLGQQKEDFEAMHAEATQVTHAAIFTVSLTRHRTTSDRPSTSCASKGASSACQVNGSLRFYASRARYRSHQ